MSQSYTKEYEKGTKAQRHKGIENKPEFLGERVQEKGFTLIEVLISLTILSLIMSVIMGGFRLGSRSWQTGQNRMEEQQRFRCVFSMLIEDIKSCIRIQRPYNQDETESQKNLQNAPAVFIGEAHSLAFITTASGLAPQLKKGKLRMASYYLGQEGATLGLVMKETPWLYQDPFENPFSSEDSEDESLTSFIYNLYPDVVEIGFKYYGIKDVYSEAKNADAEPEWFEDWNRLDDIRNNEGYLRNLPQKVRVTIWRKLTEQAEKTGISFEIPIMIGERRK